MRLVLPSIKYKESYLKALEESKNETQETQLHIPEENQSFEEFVQKLNDNIKGIGLPQGYVPATTFWLVDKNEVIGRVQIRHKLNDHLLKYGGHIGFYIRPSKRRMGYGIRILKLALKEAKKLSLLKVLVTCDDDNVGSQRIIEANGGVLENTIIYKEGKSERRRYWITIPNRL